MHAYPAPPLLDPFSPGPPLVIGIVCFAVMVGGMYGLGRESLLGVVILYHIVHVISQEVSRARESSFA